ncbi:crocetin glucosyltransferase [Populus alba x Populus x berolinensis]|uniref:Glycosyltransferase n=1 Tax=Populus alba x Populus x berolinensis TaxID=444605 RepID=A0AAD6LWP9_9ROSI|nr:crocetin glucosyltransferase [Populus alba x Populus x berolinensis]
MIKQPHFLLVTLPLQGHINPSLQFAKRLTLIGARVTLATSLSAQRRMSKTLFPDGLSFVTFSDGYDDGLKPEDDRVHYMSELKRRGSQTLNELIVDSAEEGKPITCLVYTVFLPWAAEVARAQHLPAAFLWIQPATVFDIYFYYFNGYGDIFSNCKDTSNVIALPGLPQFASRDLPSFLLPSNTSTVALQLFQEQLEQLSQETNPKVLVNSFDALELGAMNATEKFNLIGIGPLIPSAFLDGKDPLDKSFGGDLFQGSEDYTEWLNSKPKSSVVYVAFGSILVLSNRQMEEISRGLVQSGLPFLWVIRDEQNKKKEKEEDDQLSACREAILEKQGMVVPWCCQVEVLSHPSIGCFVTHCGWNSTLESLVSGVPVVAFPHWTDQGTNAKLIEDVWKTGVRVVANEEGIVEGDEIKRSLDLVMADGMTGEDLRKNAKKWKDLAMDAVKDGGSSDKNLKAFVDEVGKGCF